MKNYSKLTKLFLTGILSLSQIACATQTATRSTDLKIIRAGVSALSKPTRVEGGIKERSQAVTNGDLWLLSGRQADALELANTDKQAVEKFVNDSLDAIAEERAKACAWYQFKCKKGARQ